MMTKQQIVESIYRVLSEKISHPTLSTFYSEARLLEDLALDSASILQMLMFLELDYGLCLDEDALMNQEFDTVRSVARVLYKSQGVPDVIRGIEVFEDAKNHCVVTSLAEVAKRFECIDYEILYFGVWDAEVVINDRYVLSYHSEDIDHQFFADWYEKLYGIKVIDWYDHDLKKEENVTQFLSLMNAQTDDQHIMVMLDMFHLPERLNEVNKDPFPHYVMIRATANPDDWFMSDPDYFWEGIIKKERVLNAVRQPSVAGGYIFSDATVRKTPAEHIKGYYDACMFLETNPVNDAIREVVTAHLRGIDKSGHSLPLSNLTEALQDIPVLAPRKYAYSHGFAFFWRELSLPKEEFDKWYEIVETFTRAYKLVHFQGMKLGATGDRSLADKMFTLLDQQDETEFKIKNRLQQAYQQWCETVFPQDKKIAAMEV